MIVLIYCINKRKNKNKFIIKKNINTICISNEILNNSLKDIQHVSNYYINNQVLFMLKEKKDWRIFIKNSSLKFNISSFLLNEFVEKNKNSVNVDCLLNTNVKELPNFISWHLEKKK